MWKLRGVWVFFKFLKELYVFWRSVTVPVCTIENFSAKRGSPFCLTILKVHGNEKDPAKMIQLIQYCYFVMDV